MESSFDFALAAADLGGDSLMPHPTERRAIDREGIEWCTGDRLRVELGRDPHPEDVARLGHLVGTVERPNTANHVNVAWSDGTSSVEHGYDVVRINRED